MNRNGCGIDFLIEGTDPVTFEAEDRERISLEVAQGEAAAGFETDAEDAAGLDMTPEDAEETAELEIGDTVIVHESLPVYDGPVTVVPTGETQVLETQYRSVMSRITVAPIPRNYGLITYNGRTITVS